MNNPDRFPPRTKLLQQGREQRRLAMSDYILCKLSESLGDAVRELEIDQDFNAFAKRKDITDTALHEAMQFLFDQFKRDFDLHFYYFEKIMDSVSQLARRVEADMVNIFQPPPRPALAMPMFDASLWPWPMAHGELKRVPISPVFVLSCPRSGSTIFRLMLAAHEKIFAPPELHLLPFTSMAQRGRQIDEQGFSWMRAGVAEALIGSENLSYERAFAKVNQWERDDIAIADVYTKLQAAAGARILIDKTPFYACHPDWLARAESLFERPKYIFLTRHPRGMIQSFVKLRLQALTGNKFGCDAKSPWHLAEKWWATGNRNIRDFLTTVPAARKLTLAYENVIADARGTMERLCQFLAIPRDDNMLHPYQCNSGAMVNGIGDPNIGRHSAIDPSLAEQWKSIRLPNPLHEQTQQLARELNYELEH